MIVTLETENGPVRLEDSGFAPPSLGAFLSAAIERRHLSRSTVARKCEIPEATLDALIDGSKRLDRSTARRLERVFPHCMRPFLRVQEHYNFFRKYGKLRPDSPIARMRARRALHRAARYRDHRTETLSL
jgi:plasmid maintenance system antidote protein VapI